MWSRGTTSIALQGFSKIDADSASELLSPSKGWTSDRDAGSPSRSRILFSSEIDVDAARVVGPARGQLFDRECV